MKKIPHPVRWSVAFLLILAGILVFIVFRQEHKLQASLESGSFAVRYLSTIDGLQYQMDMLKDKLAGNIPESGSQTIPTNRTEQITEPLVTLSPANETIVFSNLCLTGIYINEHSPLAEINGHLYKIEDHIGELIIEQIETYRVILKDSEGTIQTLNIITDIP